MLSAQTDERFVCEYHEERVEDVLAGSCVLDVVDKCYEEECGMGNDKVYSFQTDISLSTVSKQVA